MLSLRNKDCNVTDKSVLNNTPPPSAPQKKETDLDVEPKILNRQAKQRANRFDENSSLLAGYNSEARHLRHNR